MALAGSGLRPPAGPSWSSEARRARCAKANRPGCPLDLLQFSRRALEARALRPGRAARYKWAAGAGRAFLARVRGGCLRVPVPEEPASQSARRPTRGAAREPPAPSEWAPRGPRCCCCCCWRPPAPGRVSGAGRRAGARVCGAGDPEKGRRGLILAQHGGGRGEHGLGSGFSRSRFSSKSWKTPAVPLPVRRWGPSSEDGRDHQCLSPFLTEDEVLENVSPGCPSKALPHWAGKGTPTPQPTLLHASSLKCWDVGMGVHCSEPQEASSWGLCPLPKELNSLLAVLFCPKSMA